jgi:hypothetical protein
MTLEQETAEKQALLRLRVATEADPNALARVLAHFQSLNITPRRIVAEFATTGVMHVQVDVSGLPEARLTIIAAKIAQAVPVLNAYWHYL